MYDIDDWIYVRLETIMFLDRLRVVERRVLFCCCCPWRDLFRGSFLATTNHSWIFWLCTYSDSTCLSAWDPCCNDSEEWRECNDYSATCWVAPPTWTYTNSKVCEWMDWMKYSLSIIVSNRCGLIGSCEPSNPKTDHIFSVTVLVTDYTFYNYMFILYFIYPFRLNSRNPKICPNYSKSPYSCYGVTH